MFGWKGKVIRVNLDDGDIREERLARHILRRSVGGVGLATEYLYGELKTPMDPLSGDNKLFIFTGPLTGTPAVSSGRFCLATISPLTNYFLQSHCGGHFGPELKYSGHDGIIIEGSADDPVYISIDDDEIDIRPAGHVWGKRVKTAARMLTSENDAESKTLVIGPAGERKALISNVKSDVYRSLGRGGSGAVFGSKNLKGIVVRGTGPVEVHDGEALSSHIRDAMSMSKEVTRVFIDYGTTNAGMTMDHAGGLPTRNYQLGRFGEIDKISGTELDKSIWKGRRACFSCPIGCSHYSVCGGVRTEGPEYETIFALGSNILNNDVEALVEVNELCNELGIDTISAGVTLSWLMEASEKGLVDKHVAWGDMGAVIDLVRKMGTGEGLGEVLSRGVMRSSERYGGKEFAIHVKGMELPGYDPRITQGMALAYSLSNRGACHLRAPMYVREIFQRRMRPDTLEGKVAPFMLMEDTMTLMDCLIMCRFASRSLIDESFEGAADIVRMVTGEEYCPGDLEWSAKRIWTLQRMFNIGQGLRTDEDDLPDRFFDSELEGIRLERGELHRHIREYYMRRGCDENGVPSDETLRLLDIGT